MANEELKKDAIDELENLLGDTEPTANNTAATQTDDATTEDLLDGIGMGEKTHIMSDGADEGEEGSGEGAGASQGEYIPTEHMTAIQNQSKGSGLSADFKALRDNVQKASKIVGYLAKDEEQQEFVKRVTVRKDASGNKILKAEYSHLAGMTQKELTQAKHKASEIYEYEVDVVVRSKAPSGFQGAFVSLPVEAYSALQSKTEVESAEVGATTVLGFPRKAFVKVVQTMGGKLAEATEIVKDYIIDKKKPATGDNIVRADDESNFVVLSFVSRQVAEVDADGNPTGAKKTVDTTRVKHNKRRSMFVPGNYVPLRRFETIEIPQKLTKEDAEKFNKHYLSKFAKVGKTNAVSTIDLLTPDAKGATKIWKTTDKDGNTEIKSQFFTEDANKRIKDLTVEHWFNTDADGKPVKMNLALPKMEVYGDKGALRKVAYDLHETGVSGETNEKIPGAYTLADPAFANIMSAAKGGLTFDIVNRLASAFKAENKTEGSNRKRKSLTFTGEEAANILLETEGVEGIANEESVLNLITSTLNSKEAVQA